jgi:hypothetical protein
MEPPLFIDGIRFSGKSGRASAIRIESGTFMALRSLVFFAESDATSLPLKEMASEAFKGSGIESVFVPRTVEVIGSTCFAKSESLSSISFESDCVLQEIGDHAFAFCCLLATITVPRRVRRIRINKFYSCRRLLSVAFEQSSELKAIENGSFSHCDRLRSIVVPRNVTMIDGGAFSPWRDLSIEFEAGSSFCVSGDFVRTIDGKQLIRYVGVNLSVVIGADVEVIGIGCFCRHKTLESLSFAMKSGLCRLEPYAFQSCDSLTRIVVPQSVKVIGFSCFSLCYSLVSILFEPNSLLQRIASHAFLFCPSLRNVVIPQAVRVLESYCFSNCDSLSQLSFECGSLLERIETEAFAETDLESVDLPSGVLFIAGDAFPASSSLRIANIRCGSFDPWDEARRSGSKRNLERPGLGGDHCS